MPLSLFYQNISKHRLTQGERANAMFAYVRTFEGLGAHPNAAPKVSIIANSKADKVHDIDPLGKCALPKGPGQPDINMKDLMRPGPRQDDFFPENCPVNARQGDDQGHRR